MEDGFVYPLEHSNLHLHSSAGVIVDGEATAAAVAPFFEQPGSLSTPSISQHSQRRAGSIVRSTGTCNIIFMLRGFSTEYLRVSVPDAGGVLSAFLQEE